MSNQTDFRIGSITESESSNESSKSEEEKNIIVKTSNKRIWMWRARNQSKIKWELFILLLAVYNLFYVPYNFAFESDLGNATVTDIVNYIVDAIFMIDVVINFRTTIINEKTGEEIFDCTNNFS